MSGSKHVTGVGNTSSGKYFLPHLQYRYLTIRSVTRTTGWLISRKGFIAKKLWFDKNEHSQIISQKGLREKRNNGSQLVSRQTRSRRLLDVNKIIVNLPAWSAKEYLILCDFGYRGRWQKLSSAARWCCVFC